MAYVPNSQTPEEEQNLFGLKSPTTPNPIPPQTGGSAGTSPGGTAAAPGQASSTQFGSNAAKLSDYLSANKDQAQDFGNQVAGNLNQGYNSAHDLIDKGFGDFNTQVGASYTPPNQSTVDKAAADPAGFASDPNNISQFKSLYNDQYSGPQNFESTNPYSDINQKVNKAVSDASLVGTPGGLGTYLNTYMGANDTTPGMQALDTALLTGNPDAQTSIRNAAAPYKGLNDYLGQKSGEADTNVANAKNIADQTRAEVQNRFTGNGGVIPTFESNLGSELSSARGGAKNLEDTIKQFIQNPSSPPDQNTLKTLGMDQNQWDDLTRSLGIVNSYASLKDPSGNPYLPSNFDLTNYANFQDPNAAVTYGNAATPEDYKEAAALSQLTGSDLSSYLNPDESGSAGSWQSGLVPFNQAGAMNDIKSQTNNLDLNLVNQITGGNPNDFSTNSGFWNNVYSGKIQFNSNPDMNARGMAALQAAIRLGLFTPGPIPNEPSTFPTYPTGVVHAG